MDGKIYTFCLPDIGEGVVEGEVVAWLKREGDLLAQDEPVVTVMTDKATVELPAPYPGTLAKQHVAVGKMAIKDQPLYDIALATDVAFKEEEAPGPSPSKQRKPVPETTSRKESRPANTGGLAIPKVRRMADALGIDLAGIEGSGKDGRVTEDDLGRAFTSSGRSTPLAALPGDEEYPLTGVRGAMARSMDRMRIPQFSYFEKAEATLLIEMREKFKEQAVKEGIALSFMPFFIRALSLVIAKYPLVNTSIAIHDGKAIVHKRQNIGVAMATPQGLIVPVLKGVEEMGLHEIIRNYEALKLRAQEGKLAPDEMKEATITISNFGALGGEGQWATPLVSDPQVAIVAIAKIRDEAVVKSHELVVRPIVPVSWSFDHRIIDGERAAAISAHFCAILRQPAALL